MWYPQNKRDDNVNANPISDEKMSRYLNGEADENGWTIEVRENDSGIVSSFKDGRFIRDYQHIPD